MTGPRDLHVGEGRFFLVPTTHPIAPGSLALRRVDGVEVSADPADVEPFEVSETEAQAFNKEVLADAVQRVGAALGALGDLVSAAADPANLEQPPKSLDELAGLDGVEGSEGRAAERLVAGLAGLVKAARDNPEGLKTLGERVAERWKSDDAPEVAESIRAAVAELGERESREGR